MRKGADEGLIWADSVPNVLWVTGGRSHRRLPFFHQCPPCLAVQISAVQQVAQVQPPVVDTCSASSSLELLHAPSTGLFASSFLRSFRAGPDLDVKFQGSGSPSRPTI